MPFVSLTRLRIRAVRFLPAFALHTFRSNRQVRRAPGFRGGALLLDRRWTFWTMTAWESEAAMRGYVTSGDHRKAMPKLLDWCDEACVAHWEQPDEALPDWAEADRRMRADGRASKVRHPSPDQAGLRFSPPRRTVAGPITPVAARRVTSGAARETARGMTSGMPSR